MAGMVYDMFDKGTDIKTADYSVRRRSPIEDFAVGIPPILRTYPLSATQSSGKVVRRMLRDPFATDSANYENGGVNILWKELRKLQGEFAIDHRSGEFTHPIDIHYSLSQELNIMVKTLTQIMTIHCY